MRSALANRSPLILATPRASRAASQRTITSHRSLYQLIKDNQSIHSKPGTLGSVSFASAIFYKKLLIETGVRLTPRAGMAD